MNIANIVKRIIGHPDWVDPICDKNIYRDNKKSYTGNSLSQSNVLILTNIDLESDKIEYVKQSLDNEQAYYEVVRWNGQTISEDEIKESTKKLLGPYSHIINLIFLDENMVAQVYKLLQVEMDYLIKNCSESTLCTAIVKDYVEQATEIEACVAGIRNLIKGLGQVSANHRVIENGVIAGTNVKWEDVVPFALHLSGKYGQILNGEVLTVEELK